jgi:hypothetical protein
LREEHSPAHPRLLRPSACSESKPGFGPVSRLLGLGRRVCRPLSETASNPDQLPEPDRYYRSDEDALKKTLLRLFGFDGRIAPKLTQQSQANEQESDEETEDFEDDE